MSGAQIMSVISIAPTDIKLLQQRLQCAWEGIHYVTDLTNVLIIEENTNRISNKKKKIILYLKEVENTPKIVHWWATRSFGGEGK